MARIGIVMLCSLGSRGAAADPVDLDAKVVWAGDDFAVISSRVALPVASGDIIRFFERKKMVAEGSVQNILEPTTAVVGLAPGSHGVLKSVKKLDHLRMTAETRLPERLTWLRVGFPSTGRSNLLPACDSLIPRPDINHHLAKSNDHQMQWVRDSLSTPLGPWPDTVLIRLFDDSADEEIALERGDLDLAVFSPGELSLHARELGPTKVRVHSATIVPGVIAAVRIGAQESGAAAELSAAEQQALARLRGELFGGDVIPYWGGDSPSLTDGAARFEVGHEFPRWQAIDRFLNGPGNPPVSTGSHVHLFYLDVPWDDSRGISLGVAERIHAGPFPTALKIQADSVLTELHKGSTISTSISTPSGTVTVRKWRLGDEPTLSGPLHVAQLYSLQGILLYPPKFEAYVADLGTPLIQLLRCVRSESSP
jgi:hypothetical protein